MRSRRWVVLLAAVALYLYATRSLWLTGPAASGQSARRPGVVCLDRALPPHAPAWLDTVAGHLCLPPPFSP